MRFLGSSGAADSHAVSEGEILSTLSPDSQERVFQLETKWVKGVSQYTLGPAVRPEDDSEKSVVQMLEQALQLPQYAADRAALAQVARDPHRVFVEPPAVGEQGTQLLAAARLRMSLLKDKKDSAK